MDGFFYICVAHLKYLVSLVCNNSAMAQRHVLVLYEDVRVHLRMHLFVFSACLCICRLRWL